MSQHDDVLSMEEAIERLKTTRPTFYRWLRAGRIKGHKVGRQWRFYASDLERFLQGESPRIDLPVGVGPLLSTLAVKLADVLPAGDKVPEVSETAAGLWERILLLGIALKAEHLHLENLFIEGESQAVLRCRIDGVLQCLAQFDHRLLNPLIEAVRQQATCAPTHSELLQHGQLVYVSPLQTASRYEVRLQFLKTYSGPALNVQILNTQVQERIRLAQIDLPEPIHDQVLRVLDQGWGLVVASGPSGSGKTTTLYAAMNQIARAERKCFNLQSAPDANLPWVSTLKVNDTPIDVLKALMDSDLDALLMEAPEDPATLQYALRIVLSGHLVMTTMQSQDAVQALRQLRDLSGNAYSVSEALHLLLNQRLVRRLCSHCREQVDLPEDWRLALSELLPKHHLQMPTGQVWQAKGCARCHQGYRGRLQLTEILQFTPDLRQAFLQGEPAAVLRERWFAAGAKSWVADGLARAESGLTSLAEILRAAG